MPLQVADPQDEFSDCRRPWIDFKPKKLMWIDIVFVQPINRLLSAQRFEKFDNLAFQSLHLLERNVQEVPCTARRIEHARETESFVEISHYLTSAPEQIV